jgi:hypothetical protein
MTPEDPRLDREIRLPISRETLARFANIRPDVVPV